MPFSDFGMHWVLDMFGFRGPETCAFCLGRSWRTVVACACRGGTQHVHLHCLQIWMQTGVSVCAACRRPYRSMRDFAFDGMIRAGYFGLV
jgi:hypothetical protein